MMAQVIKIGDALPTLETGPISRHMIATYAAASGDLNPIHVDIDFARDKAGLDDVIVHGMFSMGYLGRVIADWAGPAAIRSIATRFENIVHVRDALTCEGIVSNIEEIEGGKLVTVKLSACKGDKSIVASGTAQLFFSV